jgi:FtsP/CotA-like multicopper oxidase with cupredoxin domain
MIRLRNAIFVSLALAVLTGILPVWAQQPRQVNTGGNSVGFNQAVNYGYDNFAYSPNLRKFVDALPGLGLPGCTVSSPPGTGTCNENNLGQYIPIGNNTLAASYPDADFYKLGVAQYSRKMHSDLPPTTLRGYYQIGTQADPAYPGTPQYLGPLILARSFDPTQPCPDGTVPCYKQNGNGAPVRILFQNNLPTGAAGKLFLPVDPTLMGAGMGPVAGQNYTDNRTTIHLHGGNTPWISDGTPHQWLVPAGESTIPAGAAYDVYRKGISFQNVPDMVGPGKSIPLPSPSDGLATYYWTNEQSQRLMFYHDHAYGITRLNVYGGVAAGYLLTDRYEDTMIDSGIIPGGPAGTPYRYGIPLVIQDRSFVNDASTPPLDSTGNPTTLPTATSPTLATDPLWQNVGTTGGSLWFPHEYMPNENIFDGSGALAWGRWDYGPWLNPPLVPINPILPSPSHVPETFADTMLVNGTAFPYLNVHPKAYRFRVLNAGNDRTLNLQLYVAASKSYPTTPGTTGALLCDGVTADPATSNLPPVTNCTEVKMVPAADGRNGGIPDPATAGPVMIQIGNEGGVLPQVATIPPKPVNYEYSRRVPTMLNVTDQSLLLMPAERADIIVDFSAFAGKTLILYNDAPAPMPLFDERNDLYTGSPDWTAIGGAPSTPPGYGPNTRTVMQINVCGPAQGCSGGSAFDVSSLQAALPTVYAATQAPPIVKQSAYNAAFGTANGNTYVSNVDATVSPTGVGQGVSTVYVTLPGSGYVTAPTVQFVPKDGNAPTQAAVATACLNGVTAVTVTVAGAGYTAPPAVTFTVPKNLKGSGAAAIASISGGGVSAISVSNPGCSYNGNPVVTLAPPPCTINGTTCVQATGAASVTLGGVASITVTTHGSGYMKAPFVFLNPAPGDPGRGATADSMLAFDTVIGMKNITEGFEPWYGRMNVQLGTTPVPLDPLTPAPQVPGIAMYIDPPSDFWDDGKPQVFRVTHLGVDSHVVHFHLANLQVINRVDVTNTLYPPMPNELGWKEAIRTNPFTDLIVAVKPVSQWLPFQIPQSIRLMDPTTPAGSTMNYIQPAPVAGQPNPAGISNIMTNFGWEYVWHCHLLGHEENDMMRPIVFNVPVPPPPAGLTATGSGPVNLSWTGGGNTRTYTIQRSPTSTFTTVDSSWRKIGYPPGTTLTDSTGYATAFYRVQAENGSGVSNWSNTAGGGTVAPPAPPSSVSATAVAVKNTKTDTITVTWPLVTSNQTGLTVQYATNSSFTGATAVNVAATATTYTIANALRGTPYYIRVQSFNASSTSAWVSAVPYPLTTP